MHTIEQARATRGLSKAKLAQLSLVRAGTIRHILTSKTANPTLAIVLNLLRPLGLGLGVVPLPAPSPPPSDDQLKGWLAHYGAPLYGPETDTNTVPPPETVLADALTLTHNNASVARALPLAFWKSRDQLNLARLLKESVRRGQARTLGFFLDLTSQLSGAPSFKTAALKLQVKQISRPIQFFKPTTARERKLAELVTPEIAKKWGFRMNMDMDSFATMFTKGS